MNPDTVIKCSGGAMSARKAAELFSSRNNSEQARRLLSDSFAAGVTVGENLNDWNDAPSIQADVANASDVLLVFHDYLSRSRWRDIAIEGPAAGDEIEVRSDGHRMLSGHAINMDGVWHVKLGDKTSAPIELWRPVQMDS